MWAVVPAAGQGSRLRSVTGGRPKCLIDVEGKSVLFRLLDQLHEVCDGVSVVTAPDTREQVLAEVSTSPWCSTVRVVDQPRPDGLADAVRRGLGDARTPALVVWGDGVFAKGFRGTLRGWNRRDPGLLVEEEDSFIDQPVGWVGGGVDGYAVSVWKGLRRSDKDLRIGGGFVVTPELGRVFASARADEKLEDLLDGSMKKGMRIQLLPVEKPRWNVNTPEDLREVRDWIRKNERRSGVEDSGE